MIINKFLQIFSEEYLNSISIDKLLEFTSKTLPADGSDKIFIGCVIIMFDLGFTGPAASREYLVSILKAGTVKIADTNLLDFYVKRINGNRLVAKYLKSIDKDIEFDKHLNLVLEYLEQFSFDFSKNIKNSFAEKTDDFPKV